MACSPAQLQSNRRNAQKSSGPRTTEGKARSRANSLKHGLTGEGIVLPNEDVEEIDRRFDTLQAEMRPKSEMARQLILRVALMTVRLDRSAVNEARMIAHRMRQAAAEFDDARLAEVETLYSWIAAEPATNARRLRKTPEGIDRLIRAMESLRDDLCHPRGVRWGCQQADHWHHLTGRRQFDVPVSRDRALSEAIAGDFQHLFDDDAPELEKRDRQLWAVERQVELIEAEIAALRVLREGLDLEGLELDRSEAAGRAMFDPSPGAILARKYEGANERGMYRALREFREAQAEAPKIEPEAGVASELGSSFPGALVTEHDAPETAREDNLPAVEKTLDHQEPGISRVPVAASLAGSPESPYCGGMPGRRDPASPRPVGRPGGLHGFDPAPASPGVADRP